MRLTDNTGVKLKEAVDYTLCEIMERYGISRENARKLFAESLIRNCVQDEITKTADVLLGLNK